MESDGNTTIQILDASSSSTLADPMPHIYYGTPQIVYPHDSISTLVSSAGVGALSMMFSMDNSVWDVSYNFDYAPGAAMYKILPAQAKWYRSVFMNASSGSCELRMQTVLHNSALGGEGGRGGDGGSGGSGGTNGIVTVSGPVTIGNNIVTTVSGPVIIGAPISVSGIVTISGGVTINNQPILVDINNEPIHVILDSHLEPVEVFVPEPVHVLVDSDPVRVYVVNPSDVIINPKPLPPATGKWNSTKVTGSTTFIPGSYGRTIHTIFAMNFAPDYRFLKFYDIVTTDAVDPTATEPTMTYSLVPDMPLSQAFPTGLKFNGHIAVRATRIVDPEDLNGAQNNELQVLVTFL